MMMLRQHMIFKVMLSIDALRICINVLMILSQLLLFKLITKKYYVELNFGLIILDTASLFILITIKFQIKTRFIYSR